MKPGVITPVDAGKLIVFTDLDGTLLDHDTYQYREAQLTLERLRRFGIPLILASSKTAAEMVPLQAELGSGTYPMICENGSGILGPGGGPSDTAQYDELRRILDFVPQDLRVSFEGFGDMSVARLAKVTGLPHDNAVQAAARQFSEPGLWSGTDAERDAFLSVLRTHGISARMGGRFLTLSFGATKADQMQNIADQLDRETIIALGDAPNDTEMLAAADYAIVLPNAGGHPVDVPAGLSGPVVINAAHPGPKGWHDALGRLLTQLGVTE